MKKSPIILVLGICFTFACGSSTSNTPDAGPGLTDKDQVEASDLAGVDGKEPAQDTTPIKPRVECVEDTDCPTGKTCNCWGQCVPEGTKECTEDKNCGGQAYCDPCVGWCFPKKKLCDPCNSESQCNPLTGDCKPVGNQCDFEGSRCLEYVSGGSYCGQICLADAGCPAGYSCKDLSAAGIPEKQCVPNSLQCNTIGECEKDEDCEFGTVCNNRICVPGCDKDTSCPMGMICSKFRCSAACHPINNPCQAGEECLDSGHCMVPGGCVDGYDCEDPETYCDPMEHVCKSGCLTDFDCKKASKECQDGACVDKPCPGNYWCLFGQVCNLDQGICEIPPEPFCEPGCEEDSECGPEPSKCLQLQDEDGNDKGKFCFPKCYDDPDNRCPQGYQCVDLKDQDGVSQGEVCARTCYEQPVGF